MRQQRQLTDSKKRKKQNKQCTKDFYIDKIESQ